MQTAEDVAWTAATQCSACLWRNALKFIKKQLDIQVPLDFIMRQTEKKKGEKVLQTSLSILHDGLTDEL